MGSPFNVHIGPYAEYLVPEGGPEAPLDYGDPEDGTGNVRLWTHPKCVGTATVEGIVHRRYCYWNGGWSPDSTADVVSETGVEYGSIDLSSVSPRFEMECFRKEHVIALEALTKHFGVKPEIRWGLMWFLECGYIANA